MHFQKVLLIELALVLCGTFATEKIWTHVCTTDKFCKKALKSDPSVNGVPIEVCKLNCADDGNLWPLPTGEIYIGKNITITYPRTFTFNNDGAAVGLRGYLAQVQAIFRNQALSLHPDSVDNSDEFPTPGNPNARTVQITTLIRDADFNLTFDTDESYNLTVNQGPGENVVATISAVTYFGARHGLETLSQLFAYDGDNNCLQVVNNVTIRDKPVFSYRGVMLDTSRNFISLDLLTRLIDGMSYNKLNMFHWHMTDTHSFPFQSTSVPNLTEYGAYSSRKVYNVSDIRTLVEYARIRGVKIIPEFDAPAHVGNGWNFDPAMTVCTNAEPWYDYCVQPPCGQLNPINENMYRILGLLYLDFLSIFDKDVFHMGGDEVHLGCYNSSSEITGWMTTNGYPLNTDGFLRLWNDFQSRARDLVITAAANANIQNILWTSELTSEHYIGQYLNQSDYIIQIWSAGDDDIIPFLLDNGYRTIFSNYDAWYLDCGYQAWLGSGHNWCSPMKGWQTVYDNSPFRLYANHVGEERAQEAVDSKQILGGETPLWSEQVDGTAVEQKIWPRVSALGERLWTNPKTTGWAEAERRMVGNRQRYVQRGINADRLQPEWCYQNENQCPAPGSESEEPEPTIPTGSTSTSTTTPTPTSSSTTSSTTPTPTSSSTLTTTSSAYSEFVSKLTIFITLCVTLLYSQ